MFTKLLLTGVSVKTFSVNSIAFLHRHGFEYKILHLSIFKWSPKRIVSSPSPNGNFCGNKSFDSAALYQIQVLPFYYQTNSDLEEKCKRFISLRSTVTTFWPSFHWKIFWSVMIRHCLIRRYISERF